jgi:predicted PurR-regulated permease PerM
MLTIIAAAMAIALIVVFQIRVLLMTLAGALLAILFSTSAGWISKKLRLPYWLALTFVCIIFFAAIIAIGWLVQAQVSKQAAAFVERGPEMREKFHQWLDRHPLIRSWTGDIDQAWKGGHAKVVAFVGKVVGSTGHILGELLVVIFVGIFGATNPRLYVDGFCKLIPRRHEPQAREVLGRVHEKLWWWLIGEFVAMTFIGIMTTLALMLLKIPMALGLGMVSGVLNFIPNFGPIIAAIPILAMALLKDPQTALYAAIIPFVIQEIQNEVITPLVQQKASHLPPVILILSQVFMFYWAGAWGMVLAPPLALIVMTMIQVLYVKEALGKKVETESG